MVDKFLVDFAKLLADKPDLVDTKIIDTDDERYDKEVILLLDKSDMGKIIGKDGKMISSIKTFLSGYKAKSNTNYKITVQSHQEQQQNQ